MAQYGFANHGQRFTSKAADFSRALLAVVAEDVRTWDMFRWAVIVLLALPLVFLLSLAGDIRSEMAMLKEEQTAGTGYLARMTKEIADTRVSLTKAITDTRSGLQGETAKMNTKIDMRLQQATTPSQPPPAPPKPGVKPRLR
jgi:hypothetical protein